MKKQTKKGSRTPDKNIPKISDFFARVNGNKIEKKETQEVETVIIDSNSDSIRQEATKVINSPEKKRKISDKCENDFDSNASKRKCFSPVASTSSNRSPLRLINTTPVKKTKHKSKTPEKSDKISFSTNKTPPPKLFQKTPQKVQDFSVEIIENFVKITPSKRNISLDTENTPTKSGKVQTSLLKYISPSLSNRSLDAQKQNEMTPKKDSERTSSETPTSKVKTKLNFDGSKESGRASTSKPNLDENVCKDEITEMLLENSLDEFCLSQFINTDFEEESLVAAAGFIEQENTLDLRQSKHCKVVQIEIFPSHWKVIVQATANEEFGVCTVKDFWLNTRLKMGDKVHIMAKRINSEWVIDNYNGLIVYEPDLLISSTSVVNSLFCKRRCVLNDKFQGFEPANEFMVLGTIVHTLLQETLKKKLKTYSQIEELLKSILASKENMRRLYESDVTVPKVRADISIYMQRILEFVESYMQDQDKKGKKRIVNNENWQGKIDTIEDIEENIWCTELGIKGKVDVSIKTDKHIMPLELKTGKASFSVEHKGQVLLYVMMMNKLGYKVSSGLLLYLRDGIVKEVPMSENEKRDIIILRNELAYYLKRRTKIDRSSSENQERKLIPLELPEPINHPRACGSCPYNIICTGYLKYNNYDWSSNKPLQKVKEEVLSHLEDDHLNYFIQWSSLINLEEVSGKSSMKSVQEIYTVSPADRESKGRCISYLKISEVSKECNGVMDHTFIKKSGPQFNFFAAGIDVGNYCVVSTDNRPAVVSGFVSYIDAHSITLAVDRNLRLKYPFDHFHIDTYESSISHAFNQTSLTQLLNPSPRAEKLRRIIIDKKVPEFEVKLPKSVATKGVPILKRLNKIQQRAVLKAISARDFLLIKGMPGTGKTATIVALVQLLVELGKTVLITSHTHSAVDNVCEKLLKLGVDLLRLGSETRISEALKQHSEHSRTRNCNSPEELAAVYNAASVIASTCLGAGHPVLSKRTLDVCIVDESTQVLQPTLIKSLHSANTFILVGDPDQLPPVVRNQEAVDMGMTETLFDRLQSLESTISLTLNYRMNKTITDLANSLTYNGELLVANESVGTSTLNIPKEKALFESCKNQQWIVKALDTKLKSAVKIIDTGAVWNRNDEVEWSVNNKSEINKNSVHNIHEAAIIANLANALMEGGVLPQNMGVIATFNNQVKQLSSLLNPNIDVSTVDQFQGRDKNIIFYSCTKSVHRSEESGDRKFDIMEDHRRLNVAITRAKNKLILVGDLKTVQMYKPFSKLLKCVENSQIMKLQDDIDGFSWSFVLNNVRK